MEGYGLGYFLVILGALLLIGILGAVMWLSPPKPNGLFGFRTPTSFANDEIWYLAQRRSGRAFCGLSVAFIFLHITDTAWYQNQYGGFIVGIGLPVSLLVMAFVIEMGLRKRLKSM